MLRSVLTCDRCRREIDRGRGFPITMGRDRAQVEKDLCSSTCAKALERFMANEDQVGDTVFKLVDGPCPHYIPCGGACTSVWEPVER